MPDTKTLSDTANTNPSQLVDLTDGQLESDLDKQCREIHEILQSIPQYVPPLPASTAPSFPVYDTTIPDAFWTRSMSASGAMFRNGLRGLFDRLEETFEDTAEARRAAPGDGAVSAATTQSAGCLLKVIGSNLGTWREHMHPVSGWPEGKLVVGEERDALMGVSKQLHEIRQEMVFGGDGAWGKAGTMNDGKQGRGRGRRAV